MSDLIPSYPVTLKRIGVTLRNKNAV